ncbi:MAG: 3-oxoadipyl-CoA thiolase [Alphaproteobacteria bacterium]|nr:3-oxoadipyl-CoA thiolase [Alphaproteobacteria bacterium]
MPNAYICDYSRTPIGRYGGGLATIRPDDLGVVPLKALQARQPQIDWQQLDEIVLGCANQAGEDNRNIARMCGLLAGLPISVPATTINRLCASGLDAALLAARAIKAGEMDLTIAGGVESMSRAPFVMPKAENAFTRNAEIYDTTIGWRFINPILKAEFGVDSMPETAENVAEQFNISREDQDKFALHSQQKTAKAMQNGRLAQEITPITIKRKKTDALVIDTDEHPRATNLEKLKALKPIAKPDGTVTAGNSSGVNDGAAALLIASENAVKQHGLTPIARIVGGASVGIAPNIMGFAPALAVEKICRQYQLTPQDFAVIELNEAFASQALATLRHLKIADDAANVNPHGGAIALGHPLGMSGARLLGSAAISLQQAQGKYGLATMCVGVGQAVAVLLEKV